MVKWKKENPENLTVKTKRLILDIEATGNGTHKDHAILEVAALVEYDGRIIDYFETKVRPKPNALLKCIGDNRFACEKKFDAQVNDESLPDNREGFSNFLNFAERYINKYDRKDKYVVMAYNAPHDEKLIRLWFAQNKNKYMASYFYLPFFCVKSLSCMRLQGHIKHESLASVARLVGLNVDKERLHTAKYDAILTHKLFHELELT